MLMMFLLVSGRCHVKAEEYLATCRATVSMYILGRRMG